VPFSHCHFFLNSKACRGNVPPSRQPASPTEISSYPGKLGTAITILLPPTPASRCSCRATPLRSPPRLTISLRRRRKYAYLVWLHLSFFSPPPPITSALSRSSHPCCRCSLVLLSVISLSLLWQLLLLLLVLLLLRCRCWCRR
jgi:hypothetical protein